MRDEKLDPRAREPARAQEPGRWTGVGAARDEAARALDRLDAARRSTARARREAGTGPAPAQEQRLADAAHALAEAAHELARLVRDYGAPPAGGPDASGSEQSRRPAGDGPLVTLDLAHRVGPGWRLYQFTTADRDAHRWHLRHEGRAAGTVTHVLNLRGRRTGWEAHDARGFRLRPEPGPQAGPPAAPWLWPTRTAAVRALAEAHRGP